MKVLVCGGREFTSRKIMRNVLDSIHERECIVCIIHGGTNCADWSPNYLAGQWAMEKGIPAMQFPAQLERFGEKATQVRDEAMLRNVAPDLVVVFYGDHGTEYLVSLAKQAGVNVLEVEVPCD